MLSLYIYTVKNICVFPCVGGAHVLCHKVEVSRHLLEVVLAFPIVWGRVCGCLWGNTSGLASAWASWDPSVFVSHLPSSAAVSGFVLIWRLQAQTTWLYGRHLTHWAIPSPQNYPMVPKKWLSWGLRVSMAWAVESSQTCLKGLRSYFSLFLHFLSSLLCFFNYTLTFKGILAFPCIYSIAFHNLYFIWHNFLITVSSTFITLDLTATFKRCPGCLEHKSLW